MNESSDYKNGYNACAEKMLHQINFKLIRDYGAHESIYSALLSLKEEILTECFK